MKYSVSVLHVRDEDTANALAGKLDVATIQRRGPHHDRLAVEGEVTGNPALFLFLGELEVYRDDAYGVGISACYDTPRFEQTRSGDA